MASLMDWHPRGWSVQSEVRIILCAQKATDLSTAACQRWACEFIRQHQPDWNPGDPLGWREWQVIGTAFTQAVLEAWESLPRKVQRQHPLLREFP